MLELENKSLDAVVVQSAQKCYSKGQPNVLDGLNMTVPKGCIYGLLGSSGCGKTTLLSCIVGVRKLDSGGIWVSGDKIGTKNACVPGPHVGYMPQDMSLVPEMSIINTLYYFGRINGLEDAVIDERSTFLSDLLELPPDDKLIKNLSGGQQRRVSFAASLIHKPELLILDEPTVGLDSILREKLWDHFIKIAKEDGVTIIITTHYIEEARLANRIGFLRSGTLLAETTSEALLEELQCQTLEEAYAILSQKQDDNSTQDVTENRHNNMQEMNEIAKPSSVIELTSRNNDCINVNSSINNDSKTAGKSDFTPCRKNHDRFLHSKIFKALILKNLIQILWNPGLMLYSFLSPAFQTAIFFLAVGNDLNGLVVAVVNDEAGNCDSGKILGSFIYDSQEGTCDYQNISCFFLNGFNESILLKNYYDTTDEALAAVQHGKAVGTMHFSSNFSSALKLRREHFLEMSDEDVIASQIQMRLDMSDMHVSLWLKRKLIDRFIEIHGDIMSYCNITRKLAGKLIHFEDPIYGVANPRYSDYMAPGFLVSFCIFYAATFSSSVMISDRVEGIWSRSLVQGVKSWQILISHMLTVTLMTTVQVVTVLLVTFIGFQVPCEGPFSHAMAMIWLVNFLGICFGFVVCCTYSNHTYSHMIVASSYVPIIVLNGCLWPVEAQPKFLYYLSVLMPATLPTFTLRSIMEKGYPLSNPEIYGGFMVAIGWSIIFVGYCILQLKKKSLL